MLNESYILYKVDYVNPVVYSIFCLQMNKELNSNFNAIILCQYFYWQRSHIISYFSSTRLVFIQIYSENQQIMFQSAIGKFKEEMIDRYLIQRTFKGLCYR